MTAVREIKICCIRTATEVEMALDAGATALGFVSRMPSGPGILEDAAIAALVANVPPDISSFLLTSRTRVPDIEAHVRETGVNTVQLCAPLPEETLERLRARLTDVRIVAVVHVTGPESRIRARTVAVHVDTILLDSGSPPGSPAGTAVELGGTGRTHDWRISRLIRDEVPVPVLLAGGLNPGNVRAAIEAVRPHGVDVCSGLRVDGDLDLATLRAFITAVGAA